MKQLYVFMSIMCITSTFPLFSGKDARNSELSQKSAKQTTLAESLSDEQQELKNIQYKLLQDAEERGVSFPAFEYKDVAAAIQVLDKMVEYAIADLDSGIKTLMNKTTKDMHMFLPLLDTSTRISSKMNQEKLKQLRTLYEETKDSIASR